jgi:hypothetical protein
MSAAGAVSPRRAPAPGGGRETNGIGRAELLGAAEEAARGILDAEEALEVVRQRFEHTDDQQQRSQLAAEALDHVERQLQLTRERRRLLDGLEGTLWARRNRLERFLIGTRGTTWWHERRNPSRAQPAGQHA